MAIQAAAGWAIGLAFDGISKLADYVINYDDNIIAKGQDARTAIQQQTQAYEEQKSTLTQLGSQYSDLSKGVKISGNSIKNINLTDDEFQSFLNTSNQIASTVPSMAKGWDSQGNAILSVGTNVNDLNTQISDYLTLQRDLTHYSTRDNIKDQYEGLLKESERSQSEMDSLQAEADYAEKRATNLSKFYDDLTDSSKKGAQIFTVDNDTEMALRSKLIDMGAYLQTWSNEDGTISLNIDMDELDSGEIKEISDEIASLKYEAETTQAEAKQNLSNVKALDEANWREIFPSIQSLAGTTSLFDSWNDQDLAESFRTNLSSMVSSMNKSDVEKSIKKSGKDIYEWTMEDVIQPLSQATDEQKKVWNDLFEYTPSEGTSISQAAKERDALLEKVAGFSDNDYWTKSTLAKALGYAYTGEDGKTVWYNQEKLDKAEEAMGKEGSAVREWMKSLSQEDFEIAYSIIGSGDKEALKNLANLKVAFEKTKQASEAQTKADELSLSSMQQKVTNAQNTLSSMSSVLSETTTNGGLTADSIQALKTQFAGLEDVDLNSMFVNTSDGVKLNIDALKGLSNAQNKIVKSDLAESIKLQTKAIEEQQAEVDKLNQKSSDATEEEKQTAKDRLKLLKEDLEGRKQAQSQWQAIQKQQQELFSDYSAWTRATQTANAGDKYTNMVSGLKNAYDAYKHGLVGTDDFKTYAALLSPTGSDDAANFAENYAKASRYLTEDKSGVNNFLSDLKSKDLASYNEEMGRWTFNVKDMDKAARSLGISTEFMAANFGRLRDYGIDNNFISSTEEGIDRVKELSSALADEKVRLQHLKDTDPTNTTAIEQSQKKIDDYNANLRETVQNMGSVTSATVEEAASAYDTAAISVRAYQDAIDQVKKSTEYDDSKKASIIAQLKSEQDAAAELANTTVSQLLGEDIHSFSPVFTDETKQAAYKQAVTDISKAYDEQNESITSLTDSLGNYTYEQLKSIDFSDGKWDTNGLEDAERTVENLAQALGLTKDQTDIVIEALREAGALEQPEISPDVDTNKITEAKEALEQLQKKGRVSSSIPLDFDVDTMTLDEVESTLEQFKEEKIKLEAEGDTEAVEKLNTLIEQLEGAKEAKISIQIDDQATSLVEQLQARIAELKNQNPEVSISAVIHGDAEIQSIAAEIAALPEEKQIEIGILPKNVGNVDSIVGQIEANPASVGVNYEKESQEEPEPENAGLNYEWAGQDPPKPQIASVYYVLGGQQAPANKTAYVNYIANGSILGHLATGTMLSPAHAEGSFYNVLNYRPAHADGHVALPQDEKALVNELGMKMPLYYKYRKSI